MKQRKYWLGLLIVPVGLLIWVILYYNQLTFKGKIGLVPLGQIPSGQVHWLKKEIEDFYHFSVTLLPRQPLPEPAFYRPRNRYKADLLLEYLQGIKPAGEDKIIALVQKDISVKTDTHEDWGIMGLAWLGGSCCVVSTFRLDKDHPAKAKFNERLAKVALHEVGHTLGLEHCSQSIYCLMNDARGVYPDD